MWMAQNGKQKAGDVVNIPVRTVPMNGWKRFIPLFWIKSEIKKKEQASHLKPTCPFVMIRPEKGQFTQVYDLQPVAAQLQTLL